MQPSTRRWVIWPASSTASGDAEVLQGLVWRTWLHILLLKEGNLYLWLKLSSSTGVYFVYAEATLLGSLSAKCSWTQSEQEMCVEGGNCKGWRLGKPLPRACKIKIHISNCQRKHVAGEKLFRGISSEQFLAQLAWVYLVPVTLQTPPNYPSGEWWVAPTILRDGWLL